MIRFLFRFLATIALAVAVIMAVLDATRTVAAGEWVMTSLGTSWLMRVAGDAGIRAKGGGNLAASGIVGSGCLICSEIAGLHRVRGASRSCSTRLGRRPQRRMSPFAHQA